MESHEACANALLERCGKDPTPEALVRLLEAALGALWTRTQITLGVVTLTAITERVLYNAGRTFPLLSSLQVEPTNGVDVRELRGRLSVNELDTAMLTEAIRFVLVEFLAVLGNLTGEVLTQEMHAELAKLDRPEAVSLETTPGTGVVKR